MAGFGSDLAIRIGATFTGQGAFRKAETATQKLTGSIKNLGRTIGVTFSAAALVSYTKMAVKAYGEQQLETKRLAQSLENLGLSYANPAANEFLDTMEKMNGINRDQLQPSFVALAQVTGSLTKSQQLLNSALDISAATGMQVTEASNLLSQAYVGNYKALRQLNLGWTQGELKGKTFAEILERINEVFGGQGQIAANSYSASIGKLAIASENASEVIGESLVNALAAFGGKDGLDGTIKKIDAASLSVAHFIDNLVFLRQEIGRIPGAGVLGNIFGGVGEFLGSRLSIGGFTDKIKQLRAAQLGLSSLTQNSANRSLQYKEEKAAAAARKAEADALKRQKEILAIQQKQTKLAQQQLALKKAAGIFDITKAQIAIALQGKLTETERKRLLLMQAIENENADLAKTRAEELLKTMGFTADQIKHMFDPNTLASDFFTKLSDLVFKIPKAKNPFEDWDAYIADVMAKVVAMNAKLQAAIQKLTLEFNIVGSGSSFAPITDAEVQWRNDIMLNDRLTRLDQMDSMFSNASYGNGSQTIQISLDGQVFQNAVINTVNQASVSGTPINYSQTVGYSA